MPPTNGPTATIAELYAVIGADTRLMDEALKNTEVRLQQFKSEVKTVAEAIVILDDAAILTSQVLTNLKGAVDSLYKSQMQAAEAARLEAQSIEEVARIAALRDEQIKKEVLSRTEYLGLVNQLKSEEVSAANAQYAELDRISKQKQATLDAELASRENYTRLVTQLAREETLAAKQAATEMAKSLPFMSGYGKEKSTSTGSGGGFGGAGSLGIRAGTGGINPYFRLTESLTAAIGPLMEVLFPIALMGLGIELMSEYSKSIRGVIDSLTGAVDVSKQLEEATDNLLKAVEYKADTDIRFMRMAHREGVSDKTMREKVAAVDIPATRLIQAQIDSLKPERQSLDQIMRELKGVPPGGRDIYVEEAAKKLGITGGQDLNSVNILERKKKVDDEIEELTKKKIRIQMEEVDIMDKNVGSMKKFHDAVHELPNRMPWFLGPYPEQAFGNSLRGSSQDQSPARLIRGMQAIPPPRISDFGSAPTSGGRVSSPGRSNDGIVFSPQYTINFKFDGIPADVQKFMRESAEPILLRDLKDNTRGAMEQLKVILKGNGVVVSG